jgi:hypothetical protein
LSDDDPLLLRVSIPSRGFWFFEALSQMNVAKPLCSAISIPSRGFWFFEATSVFSQKSRGMWSFQYPRGDFGFLKQPQYFPKNRVGCGRFNPLAGILVF